jgi:HprK-related kinase B
MLAGSSEPSEIVRLDVDGCRIDVATNDPKLRDGLTRYFHSWLVHGTDAPHFTIVALEGPSLELDLDWTAPPPTPGTTRIGEAYTDLPDGRLVLDRRTGMVFAFGGDVHLAIGRCVRNANRIIAFVNDRFVRWRLSEGYLLARAGAVGKNGRCLAVSGESGMGKSTTVLRLLADGLDFVSDDRLLLRPSKYGVEVLGIPSHPRVNPGTILFNPALEHRISAKDRIRLKALPHEELVALEHEYDVLVDEVDGAGRFDMRGHLAALVVLNWDEAVGEVIAREVDLSIHPDLLPAIMKSPGPFHGPDDDAGTIDLSRSRYLDVLTRRPVVEITGPRDFDAAARLSREVLDRYTP